MKASSKYIPIILLLIFTTACNKDDDSSGQQPPTDNTSILMNSEWVGVIESRNARWNRPCVLNIHNSEKLTIYAMHIFRSEDGNWIQYDSIEGNITNIIEETYSVLALEVDFPVIGESQVIRIENNETLRNDVSLDAAFPNKFGLNLARFTEQDISLTGSTWSGRMITTPGPANGLYEYPDLSAIVFHDTWTTYLRKGVPATMQVPQTSEYYVVEANYVKRGARIYLAGMDESKAVLYPYFGVLLPGGDEMLVDTFLSPRVPNYVQDVLYYGQPGVTPRIFKIK